MTKPRTPAQRAAWAKFNQLGQLSSLHRWVLSKIPSFVKDPNLSVETQKYIQQSSDLLIDALKRAEAEIRGR